VLSVRDTPLSAVTNSGKRLRAYRRTREFSDLLAIALGPFLIAVSALALYDGDISLTAELATIGFVMLALALVQLKRGTICIGAKERDRDFLYRGIAVIIVGAAVLADAAVAMIVRSSPGAGGSSIIGFGAGLAAVLYGCRLLWAARETRLRNPSRLR
jgi:hypothetical protein